MRAILQDRYAGIDALRLGDAPVPEPGPGEVLVRVRAASVHADVWHVVTGRPRVLRIMGGGFLRPKNPIPGTDMAGVVEALGEGASRFAVGDAVYGETVGGFQWKNGGTFAEYVAVAESALEPKPDSVTFEQAAATPTSALIALRIVRSDTGVEAGQSVLINGAGGALGTFAVQIAKALGAEVTAVDRGAKLPMLRSLGADHVVDYTRQDITEGPPHDALIDVASTLSLATLGQALKPAGRFALVGHDHYGEKGRAWLGSIPIMLWMYLRHRGDPRLPPFDAKPRGDEEGLLTEWLASGRVVPVVGRTYPLEEAQAALRALTTGEVDGKIVLTVGTG